MQPGYREHQELVDACRARRIEGASALLNHHIAETAENLARTLRTKTAGGLFNTAEIELADEAAQHQDLA